VLRLRRPAAWETAVALGSAPAPALAQIPLSISSPGAGAQLLQPSRAAPLTLTTTLAVFEEYNGTGGVSLSADADQNRVSLGLQIGYPVTFD
jgi:hypothetical protein